LVKKALILEQCSKNQEIYKFSEFANFKKKNSKMDFIENVRLCAESARILVVVLEKYVRRRQDTRHNDTRHNDTRHNDTRHNDTRHN
jgi:hypothetical protein